MIFNAYLYLQFTDLICLFFCVNMCVSVCAHVCACVKVIEGVYTLFFSVKKFAWFSYLLTCCIEGKKVATVVQLLDLSSLVVPSCFFVGCPVLSLL